MEGGLILLLIFLVVVTVAVVDLIQDAKTKNDITD